MRSHRDTIRLLLCYLAQTGIKIPKGQPDLSYEQVQASLRYLEHGTPTITSGPATSAWPPCTLFEYIASREPEMLESANRYPAIPMKRTPPPQTQKFSNSDEIRDLPHQPRTGGWHGATTPCCCSSTHRRPGPRGRRPATGHLHLAGPPWSACTAGRQVADPAHWAQTTQMLTELLAAAGQQPTPDSPVFRSTTGSP